MLTNRNNQNQKLLEKTSKSYVPIYINEEMQGIIKTTNRRTSKRLDLATRRLRETRHVFETDNASDFCCLLHPHTHTQYIFVLLFLFIFLLLVCCFIYNVFVAIKPQVGQNAQANNAKQLE